MKIVDTMILTDMGHIPSPPDSGKPFLAAFEVGKRYHVRVKPDIPDSELIAIPVSAETMLIFDRILAVEKDLKRSAGEDVRVDDSVPADSGS